MPELTIHDGTTVLLEELTEPQLDQLQWQQEGFFAAQIRRSPSGSPERADAFRQGYDIVTRLLAYRTGQSQRLEMGLNARYPRLVLRLLRRQRSRGVESPRLFEIGFGSGAVLEQVARAGFDVAGIEVSAHMRAQAMARLPRSLHGQLYLGDFLRHPLGGRDDRYHVVYWNDVFEHLAPDESLDFLRRAHALLAPGGLLLTITPNWHVRPSDITRLVRPPRSEPEGFHLKEYTLREMSALLRAAGFARVATPLLVTPRRVVLVGGGLARLKCAAEPLLEYLPFSLARLVCRGLALSWTIAARSD